MKYLVIGVNDQKAVFVLGVFDTVDNYKNEVYTTFTDGWIVNVLDNDTMLQVEQFEVKHN